MARYIAFLRGMNLGRRRITNEELCQCFEAMSFTNVSAFLASGNVVFDTRIKSSGVAARIEKQLKKDLGYDVPTFLRAADDVIAIAEHEAFDARELAASDGKVQVALLAAKPTKKAVKDVLSLSTDDDRLAVKGSELFWLPCGNMSKSALDLRFMEKTLGSMTIRTKRTIDRLVAKYLE